MTLVKDISGQRFGRLTAESFERTPSGIRWTCVCACGRRVKVRTASLNNGNTRSCGCLQADKARSENTVHGHTIEGKVSPTFKSWLSMLARCYDPKNVSYPRYGAVGVKVCERWRESFENFLKDMGRRPSRKFSIDRVDGSLGYEPGNCRWATRISQNRNRSSNVWISVNGERMLLADWAKRLGTGESTIINRIKRGWSDEEAVTIPVRRKQ